MLAAGSYDEAADLLTADIGMDNGRALRVSLRPVWEPEAGYELKDYSVYISEDYEIDQKRPVWTGT